MANPEEIAQGTDATPVNVLNWNVFVDRINYLQDKVFDVKDYGAEGDDSTNDTNAIQDAIDAAGAGIVYFPTGIYRVTGLLLDTTGATMVGSGKKSAVIKLTTGANRVAVAVTAARHSISHLGFATTGSRTDGNETTGILIETDPTGSSIGRGIVQEVDMDGFSDAHIRIGGCIHETFRKIDMVNGWRGVWLDGDDQPGTTFTISEIYCSTFAGSSIRQANVTANAGTDIVSGIAFTSWEPIKFLTTDTLPDPLVVGTLYFARDIVGSTFKVATGYGNLAIDITDAGIGTHTAYAVSGAGIYAKYTYQGSISDSIFEYCDNGIFLYAASARIYSDYHEAHYGFDTMSLDANWARFGQVRSDNGDHVRWLNVGVASRYNAKYGDITATAKELVAEGSLAVTGTSALGDGGTTNYLAVSATGAPSVYNASPELLMQNVTEEDADNGRESAIRFKGEQSGTEVTTLAMIKASHDGAADDEKGKLELSTNDTNDGDTPTVRMTIDATGKTTLSAGVLAIAETTTPSAVGSVGDIYTKADNELYFQDGAGVERAVGKSDYAGIYVTDNAVATTILLVDAYEPYTLFDTDMPELTSNGAHGTDSITIGSTGVFQISLHLCAESAGVNKVFAFSAFEIAASGATITDVTQANPGVVTANSHGFTNGQRVKITGVVGMTELNGQIYTVANKADHTFELNDDNAANINTGGYVAYDSAGTSFLATRLGAVHIHRKFAVATDVGGVSCAGLASLTLGNTVEFFIKGLTDATNLTIHNCQLFIKRA